MACINYPLAHGSELKYYPNFLSQELADFYLETFMELPFEQGVVTSGIEHRKSCFFATMPGYIYKYAGKSNPALPMPDEMVHLMNSINCPTNSCLVNLYETGRHNIGWHADSEQSLVLESTIASVSLGAIRSFEVKSIVDNITVAKIPMAHGSLVTMGGPMQRHYKHRIAPNAKCTTPRINLTFRLAK